MEALPPGWSPAHHRVLQYVIPCVRRHLEEGPWPPVGQREHHAAGVVDRSRQHLDQGRNGRPGQRPERGEGGRQPCVRPVQQPGHDQRGDHVHGRHRRPGVMPAVTVPCHGRAVPGVHYVPRHTRRCVTVCVGQREMQHALRGQREREGRGRGVAAACQRPDRRELGQDRRPRQPPGHRALGDRVMAEGREHSAEHGEQAGPRARSRAAGPACGGTHIVPGHVITWHGRSSFPTGRRPSGKQPYDTVRSGSRTDRLGKPVRRPRGEVEVGRGVVGVDDLDAHRGGDEAAHHHEGPQIGLVRPP